MIMKKQKAKRITFYKDTKGEYRYKVQSANWHVIEATEEGFRSFAFCVRRAAGRWPKTKEIQLENALGEHDYFPDEIDPTKIAPGQGTLNILLTGPSVKQFLNHYCRTNVK